LYGSGNRFGIYQVRDGLDKNRDYRFVSMEELQALGLDVERANYQLVYTAPFDDRIEYLTDRNPVLNNIYEQFNIAHPEDYTGRSVSISDVILLKYGSDVSSHYVDRIGFVEIDGFLGDERAQLPDKPAPAVEKNALAIDSQDGSKPERDRPAASKGRLTLAERLAENKLKAARQGQPDAHKQTDREVTV
jgi:hypothetical protein